MFSIVEYPRAIENCDILWPNVDDYNKAIEISRKLREAGKPIGAVDILIASMCINRGMELLTRDSDYEKIKKLEPHFKLRMKR